LITVITEAERRARNSRGMMLMFGATMIMAVMHTLVRHLGQELPIWEVVFFRNLFGLLVIMPLVLRQGIGKLISKKPLWHVGRAIVGIAAMWMWFYSLSVVPVAEATALSFTSVIFGSIAAAVFLGERMRLRRWSAVLVGFLGAMVILRSGFQEVSAGMVTVLVSSVFWALTMILVKHLSRWDSVVCIVALNQIMLTGISAIPAYLVWAPLSLQQLGLLLCVGVCATFGHIAMTTAFKWGDASAVFPVDFSRLLWAAALGYFVFAEVPDVWTWIGGLIIFASTAYITYREAQVRKQAAAN
jgi:drug/metabolite transporter (DMT)-like permease